jgi:phosphoglycerate dehydrogenase-like enzyme
MKILVTPRSVTRAGHPSLNRIGEAGYQVVFCTPGEQPSETELRTLLPGCVGYIAGVEPVTAEVLDAAPDLRVISRNGTGTDTVDVEAAHKRGIQVLRAEGANARGVAELAIGQIFALARSSAASDAALKSGTWKRASAGTEIEGRTLGILGCGRIGKQVARMALGVGMQVLAFDQFPDPAFCPGQGFRYGGWEAVLAEADFLSLHCPPNSEGKPVLGREALGRLKRGCMVVNTARYDVMDAEAVLAALESGHLGGLALDVFDTEPPMDWRLVKHPRVVATPHIGGFTRESIDRAMSQAVDNLLGGLRLDGGFGMERKSA